MSSNLNTQTAPSFYPRSASSESPVFSTLFGRGVDDAATDSSSGMFVPVEFTFHPLDHTSGILQGDAATLDTLFDPTSLKPGRSFPLDSVMPDGSCAYYWSEVPRTGYLVSTNVDPTGVGIGIPCVISAHVFTNPSSVSPSMSMPAPQWGSYAYTADFTSDVRAMNPHRLKRNSVAIIDSTNSVGFLHYGSEDQTFHDVNVSFNVAFSSMNGFPASNFSGSVNLTIGTDCTPLDPEIGWDYHLVRRVEATPESGSHIEVLPQPDYVQ